MSFLMLHEINQGNLSKYLENCQNSSVIKLGQGVNKKVLSQLRGQTRGERQHTNNQNSAKYTYFLTIRKLIPYWSKVKLCYNEELCTDQTCSLYPRFVITTFVDLCTKWWFGTGNFVRFNRVFVITKFVITEFRSINNFVSPYICRKLLDVYLSKIIVSR
jgi:hypothetical protein